MTLPLRPVRGGFLKPFGCSWFIREYLAGNGPYNSPIIDPDTGAPQADIFYHYKQALRRETALDRATRTEEIEAKKERRSIDPERIEKLTGRYLLRLPYKASGARYHSFITYFSNLTRLGWVEPTGQEEPSSFQDNYPKGQPRKYYQLTLAGMNAPKSAWANPHKALYS